MFSTVRVGLRVCFHTSAGISSAHADGESQAAGERNQKRTNWYHYNPFRCHAKHVLVDGRWILTREKKGRKKKVDPDFLQKGFGRPRLPSHKTPKASSDPSSQWFTLSHRRSGWMQNSFEAHRKSLQECSANEGGEESKEQEWDGGEEEWMNVNP